MTVRLLLLCLALASTPALAGDSIQVSLEGRKALGQGTPSLEVHILEPIIGFEVKLKRSDGKTLEFKGGGKPGTTDTFELEQPEGRFHYDGELTVRFKGSDPGTMPLSFDTELLGPLKLTVTKEDLDLMAQTLRFKLSRPAAHAKVEVLMDTGRHAFDGDVKFQGEPAGTPLEVKWPKADGKVMKISLRAYDTSDFYTSVDLFPWKLDIPHEEVNFPTGSAEIPASEWAKLDHSLEAARTVGDSLRADHRGAPLHPGPHRHGGAHGGQPRVVAPAGPQHRRVLPQAWRAAAHLLRGLWRTGAPEGDAGRDRRARQPPRRVHHLGGGSGAHPRPLRSAVEKALMPSRRNRRMNRLALATALGLGLVGCAHSLPSSARLQQEDAKCELVRTLLNEPVPAQRISELATEGRELPVPVAVFVRKPEQGLLERFFVGDSPDCGDTQFHVVRQLGRQGLVLYLQETQDGYTYDARRAGPEELSMGGRPQGTVRRKAEGGWVAAGD